MIARKRFSVTSDVNFLSCLTSVITQELQLIDALAHWYRLFKIRLTKNWIDCYTSELFPLQFCCTSQLQSLEWTEVLRSEFEREQQAWRHKISLALKRNSVCGVSEGLTLIAGYVFVWIKGVSTLGMGCDADNASLSLPGTTLREISHRRQKECYLNDKTPPQAQLGSHVSSFPF